MRHLTFRDWLVGTIIFLAGPALMIGGLWAWTAALDKQTQNGPLICMLNSALGWIGTPISHLATFTPAAPPGAAPAAPLPPLDLLIMVDVSGSTGDYRPRFNEAVEAVAHRLLDDQTHNNRIAVANFAVDANLMIDWTNDPAKISEALPQTLTMTGANASRAAFDLVARVVAAARANTRRAVVFYTDGAIVTCVRAGCPQPVFTWDDIALASQKLREQGIELFAIGLPGQLDPLMIQVTGNAQNMKTPATLSDIGSMLTAVVTNSANVLSPTGTFSQHIDGRLFQIEDKTGEWVVADGVVSREVTPVITTEDTFVSRLIPRVLGLMPVGFAPSRFRYLNKTGAGTVNQECRAPSVLVVSPAFLLIACLPALVWTVYYLTQIPRTRPFEEPATVPFRMPPEQALAPRPLPPSPIGGPLVPTLFVGLGGWGRRALDRTRRELQELHGEHGELPCDFLALDVDSTLHPELPRDEAILLTPPPAITDTATYIEAAERQGRQYAALNLGTHANESRARLNLASGSHGDRKLAELALLRWLESPQLVEALRTHLHGLSAKGSAPGGIRQIVILTRMSGGFGGAVTLDLARIMRRMTRDGQPATGFVPECLVVADATATDRESRDRRDAFLVEHRTSMGFRQYPRRVMLLPDDPLLDRVDAEAPCDTLLEVTGDDADSVTQAAILASVLADAAPRRAMLREIDARSGPVASVGCVALTVRHDLARRLMIEDFQTRLIGGRLLGSVVPKQGGGGFTVAAVGQTEAETVLKRLAIAEPTTSPWFRLVQAATDTATLRGLVETLGQPGSGNQEWVRANAARLLTRVLSEGDLDGERIGPTHVIAAVDLLASRLRGPIRSEAPAQGATDEMLAVFENLAVSLDGLSTDLTAWVDALLDCVTAAAIAKSTLLASTDSATPSLILLGQQFTEQSIDQYFTAAMAKWAATDGNLVPDEGLLNFAITVDGDRFVPVIRGRMGKLGEFHSPAETIAAVRGVAGRVVQVVPEAWLDTAIAGLDPASAALLAERFARGQGPASGELLVRPMAANPQVAAAVEGFGQRVAQSLGQFPRVEASGADRLMMRRVWWSAPREPLVEDALPLVQSIDVGAVTASRQIMHYLGRKIDAFPVGLAFALVRQAGFAAFARAYQAGDVQLRTNGSGRESWFLVSEGMFLTDGDTRLASAAANFVRDDKLCAMSFDDRGAAGDFSPLDSWLADRGERTTAEFEHVVTLAAIRLMGRAEA